MTIGLVGLATVLSAWCAFQATLWSGEQTFRIVDGTRALVHASGAHVEANQQMLLDVSLYVSALEAERRGDAEAAAFYHARFRPRFRAALAAWESARARGEAVPPTPFAMPGYAASYRSAGDRLDVESQRATQRAMRADRASDTYVLMTMLLASVPVLATMAERVRRRRGRAAVRALAGAIVAGVVIAVLLRLPIASLD